MESRFPAMLVLWLGREFYKVKHGAAAVPRNLTLATILATWRQIDDSRKCNPFLDISIRKGKTLEYTRKLHVRVYKDCVWIKGLINWERLSSAVGARKLVS
ncbi:hypothetical protein AVEN_116842-1 [Araneus ventricosus]|uniref:Uncharacterized protein n=1 Tax=Araneus ventricosus TaxID=182803 RepID=A0A4Y2JEI5_ARAVE|nr:hypothetical protein AVEN_116842-1 [Araneus ventricosus]